MPLSAETPAPVSAMIDPGRARAARQAVSTACMAAILSVAPRGDAIIAGSDQERGALRRRVEAEPADAEPVGQAVRDPAEAVARVELAQRMQPLGTAGVPVDERVD